MFKGNPDLCVKCKGHRLLCGLRKCPLLVSYIRRVSIYSKVSKGVVDGSTPPSLVVGEYGYPQVNVYLGLPVGVHGEDAKFFDDPYSWHLKLGLEDIIELRSSMAMVCVPKVSVDGVDKLYENEVGLASISTKPVDTEAAIEKVYNRISFDYLLPPTGPKAIAKSVKVIGSPSIPRKLEQIIFDDVKASQAIVELYKNGVDFYTIVRALSIGFLGDRKRRRLVPTRWAITAVDEAIGRSILESIRLSKQLSQVLVFYGEYLYNRYIVILAPGPYKAMWIEIWHPKAVYNPGETTQYFEVREYKPNKFTSMDGGFIAARTSVLEYLGSVNRQAKVVILREILPQYIYPVGSWQIRQTVKYALSKEPVLRNPTENELREYIQSVMKISSEVIERVIEFVYDKKQLRLVT